MLKRFALVLLAAATVHAQDLSARHYLDNVKFLSSDALKGRGNGTPELTKAADFIVAQFKACGLSPVNGSYLEKYPATIGSEAGPHNALAGYVNGKDFRVMGYSDSGKFSAPVVFVGYGISWAPHYDEYAHVDVRGKIVLVLRHAPQDSKDFERQKDLIDKAITAKNHGAVGMLLVNDPGNHKDDKSDDFIRFDAVSGPEHLGIPVLQIKVAVADKLLASTGMTLAAAEAAIDKDMDPQSRALPVTVSGEADVVHTVRQLSNVIGLLPGASDEVIAIGAHYDHLGLGDNHSLAPDHLGEIHHGADDNASGTAGVIELACALAKTKHRRGLLFLAFSGEELGLYGSEAYVKHPLIPLAKTEAMINLDMIGRLKDHKVYIGDVGSAAEFRAILEDASTGSPLKIDYSNTSDGSSDHASFSGKQVPTLFFFSGLHADYHKPSDTWEKIDAPGAIDVLTMVERVVGKLDALDARPQFVKVVEAPRPVGGTGSSGYGPYFGSIPDMGESESGVKFADIRVGSPAEAAGLKAGDVMVMWNQTPINNLYDFTHVLQNSKIGDKVSVTVMRGAEKLTKEVTLTKRP